MKRCSCKGSDFVGNSHCTVCCVSFAGDTWFDAHLVRRRGVGVVAHLAPEAMGLVYGSRGWGSGTREPQRQAEIRQLIKQAKAAVLT